MQLLVDTHLLLWSVAATLPDLHQDPFDRLLVAQALSEARNTFDQ